MATEPLKASGLVWKARPAGGYAEASGRFAIERRGGDWCLTDIKTGKVRLFGTLRDAKGGADWVLCRPVKG
jgi:hypothetical protein